VTDYTHLEAQLLQRLTSSHVNTQAAWLGRLSAESLRRLVVQDGAFASGVIDGLLVTVQAGTMNIQVGGGLALYYDSTVSLPDSAHRWIEVQDSAPITVTVEAADGALPRWDVVEIAPGIADGPGAVLDFYNEATGQFVAAPAAPLKVCTPTVVIRKGTPNAKPKFPDGIDGVIPLAYIYVPAAAIVVLAADVLYRRPILKPLVEDIGPGAYDASSTTGRSPLVHGGNLALAAAGTTATIHRQFSGHFSRSAQRFLMPAGTTVELSANNCDDGLPVADGTIYFYAVPPSAVLPTGYSAYMAESEFVIQTATRIASGGYAAGQSHCIVVASLTAPGITQRGVPNPAVTFDITHPTFGVKSISSNKGVYIGCGFYTFLFGTLLAQVADGPRLSTTRKTGLLALEASLPLINTVVSLANEVSGEPNYALPAHVRRVCLTTVFQLDATGSFYFRWKDVHADVFPGTKHRMGSRPAAMSATGQGVTEWITLDDSQTFTTVLLDVDQPNGSQYFGVSEFEDSVLALR